MTSKGSSNPGKNCEDNHCTLNLALILLLIVKNPQPKKEQWQG